MHKTLFFILVAVLVCGQLGFAAPKPADKEATEREKEIKEFVAKYYDALGRHDFDAMVELCDVPFLIQPRAEVNGIRKDKAKIKEQYESGYEGRPKFDGSKHVVKSIQTYKEAKKRFPDEQAKDAEAVITDEDLVVHVEVMDFDGKFQRRMLIKLVEGKPRLVGTQTQAEKE